MQNRPTDEPVGAYRDDRDAAHAKAASLQQRCDALEAENGALRAEKDTLLREVDRLRALVPGERPRSRAAVMVAAGVVFAAMLVAGLLLVSARQPAPTVEGDDFFHRTTPPSPPSLRGSPGDAPSVPPVPPQPQGLP